MIRSAEGLETNPFSFGEIDIVDNLEIDRSVAPQMSSPHTAISRFGWLANACAVGSLLMCYAKVAVVAGLTMFGIYVTDLVPHVQAVLMWFLALLAVVGLLLDRKQHAQIKPLVLGAIGLVIMVGTLYGYYDWRILFLAYVCIIAAVFLNQNLALKGLHRTVEAQAAELEDWNQALEQRVEDQITQIERLQRLKRFLSPQVAELITNSGDDSLLSSHRRYIAALFCDLRGFTAFSEKIEPEEAMEVLQTYHEEIGKLISSFNGTIDHRAGDGLLVIFNDPFPCDAPVAQAMKLAIAIRERVRQLAVEWQKRGYDLGFGIGLTSGYATLGLVGFEGRFDYTANGNVVNLASRLCDQAQNDQIIIGQQAFAEIEDQVEAEPLADLQLKGIDRPIRAFSVLRLRETP